MANPLLSSANALMASIGTGSNVQQVNLGSTSLLATTLRNIEDAYSTEEQIKYNAFRDLTNQATQRTMNSINQQERLFEAYTNSKLKLANLELQNNEMEINNNIKLQQLALENKRINTQTMLDMLKIKEQARESNLNNNIRLQQLALEDKKINMQVMLDKLKLQEQAREADINAEINKQKLDLMNKEADSSILFNTLNYLNNKEKIDITKEKLALDIAKFKQDTETKQKIYSLVFNKENPALNSNKLFKQNEKILTEAIKNLSEVTDTNLSETDISKSLSSMIQNEKQSYNIKKTQFLTNALNGNINALFQLSNLATQEKQKINEVTNKVVPLLFNKASNIILAKYQKGESVDLDKFKETIDLFKDTPIYETLNKQYLSLNQQLGELAKHKVWRKNIGCSENLTENCYISTSNIKQLKNLTLQLFDKQTINDVGINKLVNLVRNTIISDNKFIKKQFSTKDEFLINYDLLQYLRAKVSKTILSS